MWRFTEIYFFIYLLQREGVSSISASETGFYVFFQEKAGNGTYNLIGGAFNVAKNGQKVKTFFLINITNGLVTGLKHIARVK